MATIANTFRAVCLLFYLQFLLTAVNYVHTAFSFPRRSVHLSIPLDFPINVPIWKVVAVAEDSDERTPLYRLHRVTCHSRCQNRQRESNIFRIEKNSGIIRLQSPVDRLLNESDFHSRTYVLEVWADDSGRESTTVSIDTGVDHVSFCRPSSSLCFPSSYVTYYIKESIGARLLVDSLRPLATSNFCSHSRVTYTVEDNDFIKVHPNSGHLILKKSPDAEKKEERSFVVRCSVYHSGTREGEFVLRGELQVEDVDDNPPYLQVGSESVFYVNITNIYPGRPLPIQFSVLDDDSALANDIQVRVENDILHLFAVQDTGFFEDVYNGSLFHAEVAARESDFWFPGGWYNFTVVFEDTGLPNGTDNKVVFHVHVRNRTANLGEKIQPKKVYSASISRHAALHSRVFQPIKVLEKEEFRFDLEMRNSSESILSVTPKTGIVYVSNRKALSITRKRNLHAVLRWSSLTAQGGECLIVVNVTDNAQNPRMCAASSCSILAEKKECSDSCGRGATFGRCQWRSQNRRVAVPTSRYATCSPDLKSCPDGYCDELETLDRKICPQDCAKIINGEGTFNSNSGKGILIAVGPCTCPDPFRCTCTNHRASNNDSSKTETATDGMYFSNENRFGLRESREFIRFGDRVTLTSTTACGQGCVAFVFLGVSCSLICLTVVACLYRVRKYKNQQTKQMYFGSRMSLSLQPSEVVGEERSSSVVDFQTAGEGSCNKGMFDAKWEFPRENLKFGEVLGEGEFGKVMRARAWGIDGSQEYKTVAVKMLKGNSSTAEYQDLLSEFQLLRDIVHPNVIRLLGACTQKGGPLYVIVEYAELGSLRSYLRYCRRVDYGSSSPANPCYDSGYGPAGVEGTPAHPNRVTQRDSLSFCWQIAKGMAYLSDMKLVHRDLAARNILLAAGKIIKISDFGLSRDVYEGDTYLKKSKGPVPVKWMAIESLEDHIYTTRSDVWAFGVVLWEIVTLGASPYPGILPERLFHLLKVGYRMEKPKSCSDELYRIMRSCWRESPHQRPSFKDLVQKFDRMLQDTTFYVDFTQESSSAVFSYSSRSGYRDEEKGK
ncbi:proto-oncogene tyrosine-protein kinase receptor Ret-like [Centruroides vittatus]|uniref:proto-oncogene tyrosine-protein kinase receptor Ret-like n=1 Tax=Centruroides vittatus TaxID=120091 RepID=UPI0035101E06